MQESEMCVVVCLCASTKAAHVNQCTVLPQAQLECDVELITRMETCDHLHTCHRFHACDQSHVAFQLFQKLMLDASS